MRRYKKPSEDALLTAIEAEIAAAQLSGNLTAHLEYIHAGVHKLGQYFYSSFWKYYKGKENSVIDLIFRKLGYE